MINELIFGEEIGMCGAVLVMLITAVRLTERSFHRASASNQYHEHQRHLCVCFSDGTDSGLQYVQPVARKILEQSGVWCQSSVLSDCETFGGALRRLVVSGDVPARLHDSTS